MMNLWTCCCHIWSHTQVSYGRQQLIIPLPSWDESQSADFSSFSLFLEVWRSDHLRPRTNNHRWIKFAAFEEGREEDALGIASFGRKWKAATKWWEALKDSLWAGIYVLLNPITEQIQQAGLHHKNFCVETGKGSPWLWRLYLGSQSWEHLFMSLTLLSRTFPVI